MSNQNEMNDQENQITLKCKEAAKRLLSSFKRQDEQYVSNLVMLSTISGVCDNPTVLEAMGTLLSTRAEANDNEFSEDLRKFIAYFEEIETITSGEDNDTSSAAAADYSENDEEAQKELKELEEILGIEEVPQATRVSNPGEDD